MEILGTMAKEGSMRRRLLSEGLKEVRGRVRGMYWGGQFQAERIGPELQVRNCVGAAVFPARQPPVCIYSQ